MKILKYLVFLSILSGIFLVIYRHSDKKGFRRFWVSIKIAILIAAILADLIPHNAEATDSTNATQPVVIERVVETPRGGFKPDPSQGQFKKEIVYRIKENPALVREAERMGRDQAAQKDVNNLIEQLSLGNDNPGIGNRRVKGLKNVSEARGRNEGRVYFQEKDEKIEILAKSNKDNQNKIIDILQKMGY